MNSQSRRKNIAQSNLNKVRYLLQQKGIKNVNRLDYHTAHQTLAKIVAGEVRRGQEGYEF